MNLQEIITESINSVLFRKIISEEILREIGQQNATPPTQPQPNGAQGQPNVQQSQQHTSTNYTQYANQLAKLVGSSGIDSAPVQNNQQAVEHIQRLNEFVFEVINAIENGNILSSNTPTNGTSSTYSNPYNKDNSEYAMDASKNAINYLGNGAENIIGYGNNNPFKGVFKAGVDTYNQDHNAVASMMANKRIKDAKNGNRSSGGGTGTPTLAYLMTNTSNECYPRLQTEYQQLNTNGIFGATPNVSNCYAILQNVAAEVTREMNNQQNNTQANQGGQGTTPNAPNTPGGGTPSGGGTGTGAAGGTNTGGGAGGGTRGGTPGGGTPSGGGTTPAGTTPAGGTPGGTPSRGGSSTVAGGTKPNKINFAENRITDAYKEKLEGLDRTGWSSEVYEKIGKRYKGETKKIMTNFVFGLEKILDECLSALERNSIKGSDERRTNTKSVTRVLGLNYDTRGDVSFYKLKVEYAKINNKTKNYLKRLQPVGEIMETLMSLEAEMKKNNMIDKKNNKA